jgi:hypothetical protein
MGFIFSIIYLLIIFIINKPLTITVLLWILIKYNNFLLLIIFFQHIAHINVILTINNITLGHFRPKAFGA